MVRDLSDINPRASLGSKLHATWAMSSCGIETAIPIMQVVRDLSGTDRRDSLDPELDAAWANSNRCVFLFIRTP